MMPNYDPNTQGGAWPIGVNYNPSTAGGANVTQNTGMPDMNIAPMAQYNYQLQLMQQRYLEERLRLLEIPEMQMADERARHEAAWNYTNQIATQMGWFLSPKASEYFYTGGASGRGGQGASWEELLQGSMPTMEMQQMMGNPRYLASSLYGMGMNQNQVNQTLQNAPLTRSLMGSQYVPALQNTTGAGLNPNFQFIQGNQLPVRQTLNWMNTGSNEIPLIEGMASYSGQDPTAFWKKFANALPRGATVGPTSY